jgi:hypothetical protein
MEPLVKLLEMIVTGKPWWVRWVAGIAVFIILGTGLFIFIEHGEAAWAGMHKETAAEYFEKHKDEINPKTTCPHGAAICITGGGNIKLKCIRNGAWGPAIYTTQKTDMTAEDVKQNPPKGEWACPPGYSPETYKP